MSKKELVVYFLGKTSEELIKVRGSRKFPNTPGGISKLIEWIEKNRKDKALGLRIYLEATGVYHEQVLFRLYEASYWVSLLLGKRVKAYRKSLGEDSKNDEKDSYILAHMALSIKGRLWKPVSEEILQIRGLLRHRRSLINTRVAYQNRLHALRFSMHPSALVKDSLTELIDQINLRISQMEEEASALAKQDKEFYKKLTLISGSLTGLGILTMLEVISETNGFSDIKSINQLIKYAGYDIVENQSGKRAGKTRISKQGNARLRTAMYMSGMSIIRHKVAPFYNLYLRVVKRNPKVKKKAMVAVQRKLLALIYTLWKKNEAFDEAYQWKEKQQKENKKHEKQKEVALSQA